VPAQTVESLWWKLALERKAMWWSGNRCITVSKETRVRADGFVKTIAIDIPWNGLNVSSRS
jgi:hypothetical protein